MFQIKLTKTRSHILLKIFSCITLIWLNIHFFYASPDLNTRWYENESKYSSLKSFNSTPPASNHMVSNIKNEHEGSIRANKVTGVPVEGFIRANQVTAVLVEIRRHAGILLVLQQAVAHLGPDVNIVVWHVKENENYMMKMIEKVPVLNDSFSMGQLQLHLFDPVMFGDNVDTENSLSDHGAVYSSSYWYSMLLRSDEFWNKFDTPFALTLQSDTLICRPMTEEYLKETTYIGGMSGFKEIWTKAAIRSNSGAGAVSGELHVGNDPELEVNTLSHMNGAFSLRYVPWARECVRKYGIARWMEDKVMSYCHERLSSSKAVKEKDAYAFSSDNGVTLCHNDNENGIHNKNRNGNGNGNVGGKRICPLGVHKPWVVKLKDENAYDELVQNCPGLDLLERLQFVHPSHQNVTIVSGLGINVTL